MTLAYIGLGANLDEPRRQLERALQELGALPRTRLRKASPFYRSAPLGNADQPDYVNAVAEIDTALDARGLLEALQAIEMRHGRSRSFANAPRTLDLDLLLFGDQVLREEGLVVPHPRMHERAFVLQPLVEIAPLIAIAGRGSARELLQHCRDQRIERIA